MEGNDEIGEGEEVKIESEEDMRRFLDRLRGSIPARPPMTAAERWDLLQEFIAEKRDKRALEKP
ncbi:MAG: hypothetical protein JW724_03740 [Candidatus Altiarchaeota archaeon]|nr:hypothetical protein [Candidatus Altiarchaeota archaeon]